MSKTTVSSKYQVVIPKEVRKRANLREGQELQVYLVEDNIVLTPQKKWPDDYIASLKDVWKDVDVVAYLKEEDNSWE